MNNIKELIENGLKSMPVSKNTLVFPVKTFELWNKVLDVLDEMGVLIMFDENDWEDNKEYTCICIGSREAVYGSYTSIFSDEHFIPDLLDNISEKLTLAEAFRAMLDGKKVSVIGENEKAFMFYKENDGFYWSDGHCVLGGDFKLDCAFKIVKDKEKEVVKIEKWLVSFEGERGFVDTESIDSFCKNNGCTKIKLISTTEVVL